MAYSNLRILSSNDRAILADSGVRHLLADPSENPKVAKNGKLGVLTAPLHLAPARLSGFNTCAMSSAGCRNACLHTAGNPAYMPAKTNARIARTKLFFNNRATFMALLVSEIHKHVAKATQAKMEAAIRLNATSDIPWERVPVTVDSVVYPNVMALFPTVQFYDYTAITKRAVAHATQANDWPVNYHLTFSLKENNDSDAAAVLAVGGNVAAVFNVIRNWTLPSRFTIAGKTARVIDGDMHDFRPVDGVGVISGLRAKGKAVHDRSGFVRRVRVRRLQMKLVKVA